MVLEQKKIIALHLTKKWVLDETVTSDQIKSLAAQIDSSFKETDEEFRKQIKYLEPLLCIDKTAYDIIRLAKKKPNEFIKQVTENS